MIHFIKLNVYIHLHFKFERKMIYSKIYEICFRVKSGNPGILVAVNAIDERVVVNFPKEIAALADLEEATIQMYSINFNETEFMGKG